jgi:hypothetical protein|tara:strand:+ start:515 stop:712 length:198 start_codon:yes stop_codon:yes gene_type:complete
MKLKTLKDIRNKWNADIGFIIPEKELRQEAIKWHKELSDTMDNWSAKCFIEKFFNIEKSDLKERK